MRLPADGPVAQLDRASDFGSEGWGFDSLRGRHSKCLFAIPKTLPASVHVDDSSGHHPLSLAPALWLLASAHISRCSDTYAANYGTCSWVSGPADHDGAREVLLLSA